MPIRNDELLSALAQGKGDIAAANLTITPERQKLVDFSEFKRYLMKVDWIKNPLTEAELKKFRATIEFFKKYAGEYSFDWLLIASQGYQESQLKQDLKSPRGAVGVMQVLPSTAAHPPININNVTRLDNNIQAGVKYLRFMIDNYFQDEKINTFNRYLFAMASYNAGPARISASAKKSGSTGARPQPVV